MRCVLLMAALLAALPTSAQVGESITVSVRNVDLVVTDIHGNRVRGLTQNEFTVTEGGKPREITNFSEFGSTGGKAVTASDAQAASLLEPAPRRVLIFVDNATLTMQNRRTFVPAAHAFVDANVRPGDRVMIVTSAQSFVPRLRWTTDRAAVHAMLDQIGGESPLGSRDFERRDLEEKIRQELLTDKMMGGGADTKGSAVTFDRLVGLVRGYASTQVGTVRNTISSLGAALAQFPRSPERKVVLFVGEGLPLHPGEEMWHYLETIRLQAEQDVVTTGAKKGAATAMPLTEAHDYDVTAQLRALTGAAYRRGIVIYPLNPGNNEDLAVENLRPVDKGAEFARVAANMAGYQHLARDTGGLAFIGARPAIAFSHVARDLDAYYSIGFRSSGDSTPGGIAVRSAHGYHVRIILPDAQGSAESYVQDAVIANHVTTPSSNDLGIKVAADAPVADGEKRKVSVKVMIPVNSLKLEKEGGELRGGFTVYISTGDARGNTSEVNKQSHEIRWPGDALAHLAGRSITFAVDVVLESGRDQISVGVVDQRSEKTGFDRISV